VTASARLPGEEVDASRLVWPPVDAVLLVSFGGPEGPDDVLPFLANVARGRGVPSDRLRQVARHYLEVFGGVSPLNAQNRALQGALRRELLARGPDLPVYLGNRNWHPLLADTLAEMRDEGSRHALAVVTSAYPSFSSCRQYQQDWSKARADVGVGAPVVTKLRHYYAEEGFLAPVAAATAGVLAGLGPEARLVFTAHSIPTSMATTSGPDGDGYVTALRHAAAEVVARLPVPRRWDLVFQSRSGPPQLPWLEPDVGDHLEALYADGVREVVLVPIGFISDHVEVRYDLDVAAATRAAQLPGFTLRRAPTVGTDARFVSMLRDLLVERLTGTEQPTHGAPATHDRCPVQCCPAPTR